MCIDTGKTPPKLVSEMDPGLLFDGLKMYGHVTTLSTTQIASNIPATTHSTTQTANKIPVVIMRSGQAHYCTV